MKKMQLKRHLAAVSILNGVASGHLRITGTRVKSALRIGEDMPMGLKLASLEQLKKHLALLRDRKPQ